MKRPTARLGTAGPTATHRFRTLKWKGSWWILMNLACHYKCLQICLKCFWNSKSPNHLLTLLPNYMKRKSTNSPPTQESPSLWKVDLVPQNPIAPLEMLELPRNCWTRPSPRRLNLLYRRHKDAFGTPKPSKAVDNPAQVGILKLWIGDSPQWIGVSDIFRFSPTLFSINSDFLSSYILVIPLAQRCEAL